jgi:DnaJ domain
MPEVTRYPLAWPIGWKRTEPGRRVRAPFSTKRRSQTDSWPRSEALSMSDGIDRLTSELRRLSAGAVVISTNVPIRNDGLPYATARMPDDPGVAVYFKLQGKDRCLACDRYTRLPDNMAAIAGHIESLRTIERYGVGTLDQAFAGYTALPSPVAHAIDWRDVLRLKPDATLADVDDAYRALARQYHPDMGGSTELMQKITAARDAARSALR